MQQERQAYLPRHSHTELYQKNDQNIGAKSRNPQRDHFPDAEFQHSLLFAEHQSFK